MIASNVKLCLWAWSAFLINLIKFLAIHAMSSYITSCCTSSGGYTRGVVTILVPRTYWVKTYCKVLPVATCNHEVHSTMVLNSLIYHDELIIGRYNGCGLCPRTSKLMLKFHESLTVTLKQCMHSYIYTCVSAANIFFDKKS